MKPTNRLVLALALGAVACGTDPSTMSGGGGDDDGGGGGGGGGGDDEPLPPLDASGAYRMRSTFDLATNMPGTAGAVINSIIDATDDSDDPVHWLVDQIIAELDDGPIKSALDAAKPFVVGYLNERLLDLAPDFVTTMVQVGHDFGDIAKHFAINETIELTRSGDGYVAVHTLTGAHFKIGTIESDYAFVNYRLPNVVVSNVAVTMDETGHLTIAAHKLPVAYGKLLRLGLDAAIIPMLDSSARSLGELLTSNVNCQAVGTAIGEAVGFGTTAFRNACSAGIAAAAHFVYTKIDAIDGSALELGLNGTARAMDKNNDRRIDSIQTGTWAGTLTYGGSPTPLIPAMFSGERM
jgi:hypothetical protein